MLRNLIDALAPSNNPALNPAALKVAIDTARRILDLEDDLAAERALTARLHERLAGRDGPGS